MILLFAAWIVAAAGGYGLFAHHCSCTGNEYVSIIYHTSCAMQDDDATATGSCCSLPSEGSCPVGAEDNCCDTDQVKFFKTSEFTTPVNGDIKPLQIKIPAISRNSFIREDLNNIPEASKLPPDKLRSHQLKLLLHFNGSYHSDLTCLV